MVTRTAKPATGVRSRTATASAKKAAPAPARKTAATRTAAPAKKAEATTGQTRADRLVKARATGAANRAAATAANEKHPTKNQRVTGHDIFRAIHTLVVLLRQYGEDYADELDQIAEYVAPMGANRATPHRPDGPARKAKVDPEDRVADEYYDAEATAALPLRELRELAADLAERGVITETKTKTKILKEMEEAGLFRELDDEGADEDDAEGDHDEDSEEDEVDDDDSDEEELDEETYERSDLKKMTLKELQELAEINGVKWKGLDQKSLIDTLLGEEEDEEEEEESEDDEDEEVFEIDPDELDSMSVAELLQICEKGGFKVPVSARKNKQRIIDIIIDNLGEEEDEDEEE